jgi:hypothetical protein
LGQPSGAAQKRYSSGRGIPRRIFGHLAHWYELHYSDSTRTNFAKLVSLIYGGDFNIFDPPGVPYKANDVEYEFEVLKRQFQFFGPFPAKYEQIADTDTVEVIIWLMENLRDQMKPFHRITEREIRQKDKEFIGWFMRLDPRDRPTATEILAHKWWQDPDTD